MSSQIYYENVVVRIPSDEIGTREDMYLQLTLDGASNSYNMNDQRVRKWHVYSFGPASQLMADAIQEAHYFSGCISVWKTRGRSGTLTAQQWIRKVRRAIGEAKEWRPSMTRIPIKGMDSLALRGKNEQMGKDQVGVIKGILAHYVKTGAQHDPKHRMQFWQHATVSGPGER